MYDDVRPGRTYGRPNSRRIEAVGDDGFSRHPFEEFSLPSRTGEPHDGMTCRDQCGNQRAAYGAGGACDKNFHGEFLQFRYTTYP
jgi:hypothetical protein